MKLVAVICPQENPWAEAWMDALQKRGMKTWQINEYSAEVQRDILTRKPSACVPIVLDEDVLAKRNGSQSSRMEAALALEWAGVPMLNSTSAIARSTDKLQSARALQKAGLLHPRTFALGALQDWPFKEEWAVLKPSHASSGSDIHLVSSLSRAREISRRWKAAPLVQQWIQDPVCYRVIATPTKTLYCIEKRVPKGELIAATNFGAERIYIDNRPDLAAIAQQAVAALGGGVMGIDILEKDRDLFALEANPAFAFDLEHPSIADDIAALVA